MTRIQGGLSGYIRNAASVAGIDGFDRQEFNFWLHNGKIHRRTGDIPPWSDRPAERLQGPRFD